MNGIWAKGFQVPIYNGNTFKVYVQFPGEGPQLFPKLTTVLGRGREEGRNIRHWLKADCHRKFTAMWRKPGILVSGGHSAWVLVCIKANEWWEETPQEFPHLLFVFQKYKYNSQTLSSEMNGQTSRTRTKDQHLEKGLLDATKVSLMNAMLFMGWETENTPQTSPGWSFLLLTPVFKLMDFKLFIP